ncbi:8-amino-7-oxononanoate synthase [Carnimonas bestiolae]|uniref:8-amino-7-oxononanoate synthase n=1 Tax=Carnimonas bestiolae TaxID=3402172 RepID=UPI003EDC3F92
MTALEHWLTPKLTERKLQQRYRQRWQHQPGVVDFAGNDYLGFSQHPAVTRAASQALEQFGSSAAASPLVGGYCAIHQRLEERVAAWLGRERALLFPSGFQANLAVLDALCTRSDYCLHDRLNHASLLDGTRLSGARLRRYAHLDSEDLEQHLQRLDAERGRRFIVSDGIFSMDGDIAPLGQLSALAAQYDATLIVDDAHGVGVMGSSGAGVCEGTSRQQAEVVIGTFSKALGSQGAFVAGSETLIEGLIQLARPYIYSTGLAPMAAAAADQAVQLAIKAPEHRERLHHHIALFQRLARAAGLTLLPSVTPIQGLVMGNEPSTMALGQQLLEDGLRVGAIRPPTVPTGSSRLRITLSARHRPADIQRLVERLARHCDSARVSGFSLS